MRHPASSLDTKSIEVGPVILLGAPGADKGTQAERIAAEYNMPRVSTGEVLRQHVEQETVLGLNARGVINRGMLVDDDLVCAMVGERIRAGRIALVVPSWTAFPAPSPRPNGWTATYEAVSQKAMRGVGFLWLSSR
jgi:hypothetical protein